MSAAENTIQSNAPHTAVSSVFVSGIHPLDDPKVWLRHSAFSCPLTPEQVSKTQAEIDAIIGTTRNNESIAKLVWSGDTKYWKERYNDWDIYGKPVGGLIKRPWLLYKTILDTEGTFVRDAFVPRFMILTRIEPEQFTPGWNAASKIYCPDRKRMIQFKAETPPKEYFVWFMTIARHTAHCCGIAAGNEVACFGGYVHPMACLDELRTVRRSMEASGDGDSRPFDTPDALSRRIRENMTNNYEEQAMNTFRARVSKLISEAPLAMADMSLIEDGASLAKLRANASEQLKRQADEVFRRSKQQRN